MSPETRPVTGYVLKMYPRFSETFVVSEILAREARGEKIVIFALRPTTDARFHPELARVAAEVIHVPRAASPHRWWDQWQRTARCENLAGGLQRALPELLEAGHDDAGQAVALARLAREHGVTHLHAHFASVATTVARLAGRIAELPYSCTAHAKDIFHLSVDEADLARKFADAHHVVTISQYNLADLRRRFPGTRLHLVHNGLELDRFPYRPHRESGTRILAVGRLVEKKGFGLLIGAAARLRERGTPVSVDIVGDGPLAAELAAQITAAGLENTVRLLGPRTQAEVRTMLAEHDVFAAPFVIGSDGNADGLPTVLLEAMASGIRCVAGDVTAVSEVIVDGRTGRLVPTGDVAALTDALASAIAEGAEGLARLDAARALIETRFDSRRQAARLAELQAPGPDTAPLPPVAVNEQPAGVRA